MHLVRDGAGTASESTHRQVFRTTGQAMAIGLFGFGGALFCGYFLALILFNSHFATGAVLFVLPFVIGFFYLLRATAACVVVDSDGITIRNVMKTEVFSWHQISRFRFGASAKLGINRVGIVDLTDGREVAIFGIQGANPLFRSAERGGEGIVESLNRILEQSRRTRPVTRDR